MVTCQLGDLLDNEDKLQALKKSYEHIEISEDVTIDENNSQYRRLSKKYYPEWKKRKVHLFKNQQRNYNAVEKKSTMLDQGLS